jgi:hypothetical protein
MAINFFLLSVSLLILIGFLYFFSSPKLVLGVMLVGFTYMIGFVLFEAFKQWEEGPIRTFTMEEVCRNPQNLPRYVKIKGAKPANDFSFETLHSSRKTRTYYQIFPIYEENEAKKHINQAIENSIAALKSVKNADSLQKKEIIKTQFIASTQSMEASLIVSDSYGYYPCLKVIKDIKEVIFEDLDFDTKAFTEDLGNCTNFFEGKVGGSFQNKLNHIQELRNYGYNIKPDAIYILIDEKPIPYLVLGFIFFMLVPITFGLWVSFRAL